jgi:hypothetical protein
MFFMLAHSLVEILQSMFFNNIQLIVEMCCLIILLTAKTTMSVIVCENTVR